MKDTVILDHNLADSSSVDLSTLYLNGVSYLYQTINTVNHKPMHLGLHLELLSEAWSKLYGSQVELDDATVSDEITLLLKENRFPRGGNIVDVILIPDEKGKARILIANPKNTIYQGYALGAMRLKCIITNYELPFENYHTALSRSAAEFVDSYARRQGFNAALRANRAGYLISTGDHPLFALSGQQLIATSIQFGARKSVETELVKRMCSQARLEYVETGIMVDRLTDYDELLAFTPTGILSVLSCSGTMFLNLAARRLERVLPQITREGIR